MNKFEILLNEIKECNIRTQSQETTKILNYLEEFANGLGDDWISIDDKLPSKQGDYLVYYVYEDMKPFCSVCEFSTYLNMFDGDHVYITHWQPLPQPPKE